MPLRVALCQINAVVGDLDGNTGRIIAALEACEATGARLAVFPELAITGYPPEDLVLKDGFVADTRAALGEVIAASGRVAAVVGFVEAGEGGRRHNSVALCDGGQVVGVHRKRRLPNYSVFDEARYFEPGREPLEAHRVDGVPLGLSICEDAWASDGPIAGLVGAGATAIVNVNASPYHQRRVEDRQAMLGARTAESGVPILYVNLVGGQDELVFDGASLVVDGQGDVVARSPQFREHTLVVDLHPDGTVTPVTDPPEVPLLAPPAELWEALVLGTRDYAGKNGFSDVVLGLSGGVDSALVAVIAADALGPGHVHTVALPSRFSSEGSLDDAAELARRVGTDHRVIPIEPAHAALLEMLQPSFGARPPDVTEENLQARIRGTVLKSLENKLGWLLLATGNKTEMAVGYATLYGDMNGGFNPIKDVLKTDVFELARWRNEAAEGNGATPPIPEAVISKAPSAELRPDQTDQDTLPPYEELDPVVEAYVEDDKTVAELVADGHPEALVQRVARMVEVAEHKRRQAPPGVRVSSKAFGKDRRMPITNLYPG